MALSVLLLLNLPGLLPCLTTFNILPDALALWATGRKFIYSCLGRFGHWGGWWRRHVIRHRNDTRPVGFLLVRSLLLLLELLPDLGTAGGDIFPLLCLSPVLGGDQAGVIGKTNNSLIVCPRVGIGVDVHHAAQDHHHHD